ncbi:MAG: GDSL-type esterase/lipase family protein, partial [Myxococcaceae bacterium]
AIDKLLSEQRTEPIRVVHLGDSLSAADHISDMVRARLQRRYGSGGKGFLFVDRPTRFSGRKVRTGEASGGWKVAKLTDTKPPRDIGFSGVSFNAGNNSQEKTEFEVDPASRKAEVFYVSQPNGGSVEVRSDGKTVANIATVKSQSELGFMQVPLPQGAKKVQLLTRGGPVQIHGLSLESESAGMVYDSIGLPGATAAVFLRADEKVFAQELARRNPSLVLVMLGGNEAYRFDKGWAQLPEVKDSSNRLLARIRKAVPNSACLVTSPMDAGFKTVGSDIRLRKGTLEVANILREVAFKNGCAFWNMYAAMGGEGAVRRWLAAGLMNEDLVHPRAKGADLMGHLIDFAIERAFNAQPPAPKATANLDEKERQKLATAAAEKLDPPGLINPSVLDRVFDKLRRLESGQGGRVGLVQLGASHTASQMFTDELRERMVKRFGGAGRGFIALGDSTPRLAKSRIIREKAGTWEISDALNAAPGQAWSLTGSRPEGNPGASMSISFCDGCEPTKDKGHVELYYLEEPKMGRLQVLIDGQKVAELPRKTPKAMSAKVESFPVVGQSHRIQVKVMGPAPATVFGAAFELDKEGIIYDALGLPGATSIVADNFDKEAFATQLRPRKADLFVLFYGTNESGLADLNVDNLREHFTSLLRTLKKTSEDASCLVVGPTDRAKKLPDGSWVDAPSQMKVIRLYREVATKEGCAFWSARAAMGGNKAMLRWRRMDPPLGNADGVHLTSRGYAWLARVLLDDLLGAYEAPFKSAVGKVEAP